MKKSTEDYLSCSVLGLVFIALIVLGFNIYIETPIREINSTKWIQEGVIEYRIVKLPPAKFQPVRSLNEHGDGHL